MLAKKLESTGAVMRLNVPRRNKAYQ